MVVYSPGSASSGPPKSRIQTRLANENNQLSSSATGYETTTPWWLDESSPDGRDGRDRRKIPEDDIVWGNPDSFGNLVNGQFKGVQVLETLKYDPSFVSSTQAFAEIMNAICAGCTQLQSRKGNGYIPAGDGNIGPMIGFW